MGKTVVIDGEADLLLACDGELCLCNRFDGEIESDITIKKIVYPYYEGETTVIPKIAMDQVLNTREKTVLEDITVKEIPVYSASNPQGGNTVYIGGNFSYG